MTKGKQALLAAASSTVCAAVWLANCAVDVVYGCTLTEQLPLHILLTAVWAASAACWWLRWRSEKKRQQSAAA